MTRKGQVALVGAGPGDVGLITVKGLARLRNADVVLYDRLTNSDLLQEARNDAVLIDVGKLPGTLRTTQEEINQLLVSHAREGRSVVRLKGGDPFVFGRGSEELDACRTAGIDCEVVPGISSALAAPAAAGIPVTLRGSARHFTVLTAHDQSSELPNYDFDALAKMDTLVVLMGRRTLKALAQRLIAAGRSPLTPAATISDATTRRQRVVAAPLINIADAVDNAKLTAPVVTIIGTVASRAASMPNDSKSTVESASPDLKGRRVVLTQANSTSSNLRRMLLEKGADVVHCPLIEINGVADRSQIDCSIEQLRNGAFDWLVFTSVHGVRWFWHHLQEAGFDARILGGVRLAGLGPGTAAELQRIGLRADLIPKRAMAVDLVAELGEILEREDFRKPRILFPRGNLALPTITDGLSARGCTVSAPIVYETRPVDLNERERRCYDGTVDAILFCSPSAVDGFIRNAIDPKDAAIGCIGATTAAAANAHGLDVQIIPDEPGSRGLVRALIDYWAMVPEGAP